MNPDDIQPTIYKKVVHCNLTYTTSHEIDQ